MTSWLETSQIGPPPGSAAEQSLPLTFIDINWLTLNPIRRLFFYDVPACSKSRFLETIVPNLKQSLSLTLKHFSPLSGNIIYPCNSDNELPTLRYASGDSVSLTVCESSLDLDDFVANHARDADVFYDLIPQSPPITHESNCKLLQVLALQVTLFPGAGLCIGIANHHSAGDASSIAAFLNSWASITKLGGEEEEEEEESLISKNQSLPVFDRSLFNRPSEMDSDFWNQIKKFPLSPPSFPLPTNRVRATFVLGEPELDKLKRWIQSNVVLTPAHHLSSFVAASAYIWSCLAKSNPEEEVMDLEHFLIPIDIRARLDPPVPSNYFGNCLSPGLAEVGHGKLISDDGIFAAAQAIAKAIGDRVSDKEKILEGAGHWLGEVRSAFEGSILAVFGSARVDLYGVDFGWGRARRIEVLSIDGVKYALSVCKFEGGLEIGMSLPKAKMDAFHALFIGGLKNL